MKKILIVLLFLFLLVSCGAAPGDDISDTNSSYGNVTVTFDSQGGTSVDSQTTTKDSLIVMPADPVRSGYNFAGWYKEAGSINQWNFSVDTVTTDITIFARWTLNTVYTVTYKSDSDTVIGVQYVISPATTVNEMVPVPARTGWTFAGWYTGIGGGGTMFTAATTVTADITVFALWTTNKVTLEVSYEHGTNLSPVPYGNIYVAWIENQASTFLQNIRICTRIITPVGGTGAALPYWRINKRPISDVSEVNAVTGATIANANFKVSADLKDLSIRKFTLYFEVERSFDGNDWFTDQPALLYSADIDLDSNVTDYELVHSGWTPNESTQNIIPGTPVGVLQTVLGYITKFKSGTGFGEDDTVNRATNMVNKITVKVTK